MSSTPIDLANWLKLRAWLEPQDMKPGDSGRFGVVWGQVFTCPEQ